MMCDNESYWKAGIELMTNADPQETQHSDLLMPTRSLSGGVIVSFLVVALTLGIEAVRRKHLATNNGG